MPRSDEAAAICKMLCVANVKPFYISFRGHDNGKTIGGGCESIENVVSALQPWFSNELFWAFGFNCTPIHAISSLLTGINTSLAKLSA